MSRSFKKSSFSGIECAGLGAYDKSSWNRLWRRANKIKLDCQVDLESYQNISVYAKCKGGYGFSKELKRFYKDSKDSLKKDLYFFRHMQEEPYDIPFNTRGNSLKNYKRSIHKFWGK